MATPITLNLTDGSKAWKEIQSAIRKTLQINNASLQSQAQQDLQTQATAVSDGTVLEMTSSQLNGPVTGFQIPTVNELFAPLRTIVQQPDYFPCGPSNPFVGTPYVAPPTSSSSPPSGSPPSSPPLDPQFCYVIQRLMYLALQPEFANTLKPYKNYEDATLEDEALGQLEKAIVADIDNSFTTADMLNALSKAWQVQTNPTSPPTTLMIQPAISVSLYNQVQAWLKDVSNDTEISDTAAVYISTLTGENSTVFPPPTGKTFLENLSNLLYANINTQLRKTVAASTNNPQSPTDATNVATSAVISDTQSVINIQPNVQKGIQETIMQQLAGVGQQGMLLADIYDLETALGLQQYSTSLIGSLPTYVANLSTASAQATALAQGFNSAELAIDNFSGAWSTAYDIINQNAQLSSGTGGQNNINIQLQNAYNGTKSPYSKDYLDSVVGSQGSQGILVNVEDYFTNISVQLAGLNFYAQSVLVQQPTQGQVNTLVSSISDQVTTDIAAVQQSLTTYASNLKSWISTEEVVESHGLTLAQMNQVSPDIETIVKNTTPEA